MQSFQFKIKGYLNETGEYTEFYPAESGTIIQLILRHWFNESIPNNLDIIAIKNGKGDLFVIDHVKRDVFDYYFFGVDSRRDYYHKKTDIQFMFFALESFFNDRIGDIRHNFTRKDDDLAFLRGDFLGKDFNYRISRRSLWKNFNWIIFQLGFFVLILLLGFIYDKIIFVFAGIYLVIIFFNSYKQFRMYHDYYMDNKKLAVKLSRASDRLQVTRDTWAREIPKSEIRKITKYVHPVDSVGAMHEFYTEIEFFNGNVLNLTCLLIPQTHIENKFANDLVTVDVEVTDRGNLKRKTMLDQYFSAIKPLPAGSRPQ